MALAGMHRESAKILFCGKRMEQRGQRGGRESLSARAAFDAHALKHRKNFRPRVAKRKQVVQQRFAAHGKRTLQKR